MGGELINAIIILSAIIILLLMLIRYLYLKLKSVKFAKSSLSSRYGKMAEQFMPFIEDYPYLPENFRFLGTPIDGVQFEEDKIIFVEFKTASSQMSTKQKNIQNLVNRKKVEFEEIRLE
jgi:predicted Holliday junction resolvase-like endonuclease